MSERIQLFRFVEGVNVWTVTSSNRSVTYNSETYTPLPIGLLSDIESKQSADRATLDIGITANSTMAQRWTNPNLSTSVSIELFIKDGATVEPWWNGTLSKCGIDGAQIKLTFDDGVGDTRFGTNSPVIQISCPYVLYGWGCFLDKEDFADSGTIGTISGLVVTISEAASQADGWYNGGMLKAVNGDLVMIVSHVGNQLTLIRSAEIAVSDAVTIYQGCDRTIQTCDTKFSNKLRYGGYTRIPTVNIFTGSPLV